MTIATPRDLTSLIRDAPAAGNYASTREVIREATRDWKFKRAHRQRKLDAL
ncbi:hypothetical protein [Paraburkholderia caballeronis]|uniref:hypothetical protein n=1 Tax=Paraburkholderia caballeronis TaxID=416943 RepID=UPI001416FE43|nr:hypothetical protein [Paraburkholderia caballeronis]